MDKERTFNAFRICITDRKCENTNCPYEYECEKVNSGKANSGYIQIPKVLALDVMKLLKGIDEKDKRIEELEERIATMTEDDGLPISW